MLFLIGLELDLEDCGSCARAVFVGGGAQLGITGALLSLGLVALGLAWPSALLAGFALAMSSTAIGMQVMGERNMTPTPAGRTAFAILLFQDIAAIPLIAVIPLVAQLMGLGSTRPATSRCGRRRRSRSPRSRRSGRRPLSRAAGPALRGEGRRARGVHRLRAAAGRRHRGADELRGPVDGARRVHRRRAARRAPNTAARSRPTSSRSRACCSACSSSASACRSTSAK